MGTEYYYKKGACYDDVKQNEKIFLIYTYKCNAACEHCLTESDPQKKEKLSVDVVKDLLRKGVKYGKNWLMISGGEPLLYFNDIIAIYQEASKLGYYCCLGSNAFWAKSPEIAYSRLSRLKDAGLKALFPSATSYHAKYVPPERVAMAAEACHKLDLLCEINFYPSQDVVSDARIKKMLGLDGGPFYTDGLVLTGRDVAHLCPIFEARQPGELDDCGSIHLSITPRGEAIANCNVTYRCTEFEGSIFHLGNIFRDGIDAVLANEQNSTMLQLLMAEQRNVVHDVLCADGEIGKSYVEECGSARYYSATAYYLDVLANPKYRDALQRAAKSHNFGRSAQRRESSESGR